jgi:hypothetical protein
VGPGFHSLVGDMRELNQPASRRTFRWSGAAREMVRIYLNTAPSELSGKDKRIRPQWCTRCNRPEKSAHGEEETHLWSDVGTYGNGQRWNCE